MDYANAVATTNFNMSTANTRITDFSVTTVSFTGIEHFDVRLGAGNDNVTLGDDADTLRGGAGNDVLNTGAGAAVVEGGLGADRWVADFSADGTAKVINLNLAGVRLAGNGTSYTSVEAMSVTGGAGADRLTSQFGNIDAGLGDTLNGGGGNDTLTVGGGVDQVEGGEGDDLLILDFSASVGHNFNMSGTNRITDFSIATVSYTGVELLDLRLGTRAGQYRAGGGE